MLLQLTSEPTMSNEILSTVAASALVVSALEWLKNTKWLPFVNQHSAGINRMIGWLAAFCTGTGIHYTFNQDAGVLTITGLSAGIIIHTITTTSKQYAVQWLIYQRIKGRASDVAAIAEGVRPVPVASPGAIVAGAEQAAKP